MRHGNKVKSLGRKYGHRKATLSNLAVALILNKRIVTTVAKAKELRKFVEPIITRSKENTTSNRRQTFRHLRSKYANKELFEVVGPAVGERNGGYVRIIKAGFRPGDNAEMAYVELVDFNNVYSAKEEAKKKTRRSRRGGKKAVQTEAPEAVEAPEEVVEATTEAPEQVEEPTTEQAEESKETEE